MSAEAVVKLLKLWLDCFADGGLVVNEARKESWYETNLVQPTMAALATAPPEQAAPAKSTLPVGVSVLVTNGELVLLGERINNTASGLLSTPGGRVEQNEDIFACAVRETQEETGLSLTRDLLKVIAWREHFRFGQHYIMFYVHAPQSFGTIINKEPDKCKAWGWRTISQIKSEETTEPLDILALLNPLDPPQAVSAGALIERITAYLSVGGLFNPEMAEHVHVRDLLIACREALLPLAAHDQKVRAETPIYTHFDPNTHVVTVCEHSPITAEMVQKADACWSGYGPGTWSQHLATVLNRLQAAPAPAASKPGAAHE